MRVSETEEIFKGLDAALYFRFIVLTSKTMKAPTEEEVLMIPKTLRLRTILGVP